MSTQLPSAIQTTLLLKHFSYEGASYFKAGDLTSVLLNIIDVQAYYGSEVAAVLAQSLAAQKAANTNGEFVPPLPQEFYDLMDAAYTEVVEPLIEIALASQDDDVIRCAIQHSIAYLRQAQLLALDRVWAPLSANLSRRECRSSAIMRKRGANRTMTSRRCRISFKSSGRRNC